MDEGTVIIGAGHAGTGIAAALRAEGYEGPITLLSAENETPYHRPPLSKTFLKTDADQAPLLRPATFYCANRIELRLGTHATAIDLRERRISLSNGRALPFTRLAIATGARACRLAAPGGELDGVRYLRTIDDARQIRSRLHGLDRIVIVGGGFIGLELAATLSDMGVSVTLLELADRLMARAVAPEVSRYFLSLHRAWGVDVLLGQGLRKVIGNDGLVSAVETTAGRRIEAPAVIVGVGVVPNVELAKHAGAACDNGILVDEYMRAGNDAVVAAGDCAAVKRGAADRAVRLESVQNASDQARIAAKSLLGRRKPLRAVPWFWSDQRDTKLQMAGLANGADERVVRGTVEGGRFSVFQYRAGVLVAVDSVNQPADHLVGRKLLAAGISPTPEQARDPTFDLKTLLV